MRKFNNKRLPRGILIDRGYVSIRIFPKGQRYFEQIGPADQPRIIDQAEDRLNEIRRLLRAGKFDLAVGENEATLGWVLDYYHTHHGSKKASARNFGYYRDRLKKFFGVERAFHTLTHRDVESYKEWLEKTENQAVGSVNKHLGMFTHVFNFMRKEIELEHIKPAIKMPKQQNPAALVETDSEEDFTRTRVLSMEEFGRLLDNATPRGANIIRAAVFTLLRLKDLRQLGQAKVNTENDSVSGTQSKTGMAYRLSTGGAEMGWLFNLDWTNFRREWQDARDAAGLVDVEFRDLRRTGATWLFRKTNDIGLVQRRLGHSSPVTTKKYLGIMEDDEKKGSEILGGLINTTAVPIPATMMGQLPSPSSSNG